MSVEGEPRRENEAGIWLALLVIIVIFTGVILYARHVNLSRGRNISIVARYTNYAYGVNLRFPPDWRAVGGQYDRYEGADGFFSVSAAGGPDSTLESIVESEANHKLKPYGSAPSIEYISIDSEEARLIMPSADQDPSMHGQAVIIAKYPVPMKVGQNTYYFLVLWADKDHIREIADSVTFVRAGQ